MVLNVKLKTTTQRERQHRRKVFITLGWTKICKHDTNCTIPKKKNK